MINAGSIGMPLHFGKVPGFLTERMGRMGDAIVESVAYNYGTSEVLTRFSDPNWFQALGAVMGMHWNSSGVTATVLGSLRPHINRKASDIGLYIMGGKGKQRYHASSQIKRVSDRHGLPGNELIKSCRLTGRIDNNAVQDGYDLYQQYFLLSKDGEWSAISQGMNKDTRRARRYHWHSPSVRSFVAAPHSGIAGIEQQKILNLVDKDADMLRQNMVAMTKERPKDVMEMVRASELPDRHDVQKGDIKMERLASVLNLAYEREIEKFEDLVELHGVGPRTLKSLAMASELVHGDATRFEDPARFAFAVGGKDGRPHPIDTEALDETISMLQNSIDSAKLGDKDKSDALKRLHNVATAGESTGVPLDFLQEFIEHEWSNSEKNGGKTFMGTVVPGLTKAIMGLQNGALYGRK